MNTTLEPPAVQTARANTAKASAKVGNKKGATHGMTYRFQIGGSVSGQLLIWDIDGSTKEEAISFAEQMGMEVKAVGIGRPVIPDRDILNGRDEIAAFLGIEESTINKWISDGVLKYGRSGELKASKARLIELFEKTGLQIPEN